MNRRDFLKVALGGGVGFALAPVLGLPKIKKENGEDCCARCGKS